jgi:predicted MFS family arabinose efflux permease
LILTMLLGGIVVLALFVMWERRVREPMLPLSLFARRNFTFANVETLSVYGGLATLSFFLVLFLQQLCGYSPIESGLALVPVTVVMFVLSPRVGRWSMRYGPRAFMGAGPFVAALGVLRYVWLEPGFTYWSDVLPALLVFSVGLSMIVAPLTATVLANADEADAGIASGVNNAVARVAGLLAIAVIGVAVSGPHNSLDVHGFHVAMAITAVLVAAGGAIGVAGIRNPSRVARTRAEAQAA